MITEKLVAEVWRRQLLDPSRLVTVEGRRLEVISPGMENRESGPDFADALICCECGEVRRGDVEIHVRSRDWQAHRHHRDPAYNRVILHVVMWHSGPGHESPLHNGGAAPILSLAGCLAGTPSEIEALVQSRLQAESGCPAVIGCSQDEVTSVLDWAGLERLRLRADAFKGQLLVEDPDEVFYRGAMRALGYAKNKEPFERLAVLLPLRKLRQELGRGGVVAVEALMLGAAGLLPETHDGSPSDAYLAALRRAWSKEGAPLAPYPLPWRFFKVRQENYPQRRLAGAARLVHRTRGRFLAGLLRQMKRWGRRGEDSHSRLADLFLVRDEGYWRSHYDFGLRMPRPAALIGPGRAADIVVNVALPLAAAWGESHGDGKLMGKAVGLYGSHPPLMENRVTRHVRGLVFGGRGEGLLLSACQQQGLLHIYQEHCLRAGCRDCSLERQAREHAAR